jgi:ElaB/YqjD/DUF883 family membrane-anchored ribosome-binding protein
MKRIEKTVFISYRRTNSAWALAVFQNLTQHGYDVFFDFDGIGSGDFERIILENIKSQAHFLVLLTPSALERCGEPADWLRREIETAIENKRNIIPIMLEGFDFSTSPVADQLTGKLATLKSYNGLTVVASYFTEAMNRLREQYLSVPLEMVLHPASTSAQEDAKAQKAAAIKASLVKQDELIEKEQRRVEEEEAKRKANEENRGYVEHEVPNPWRTYGPVAGVAVVLVFFSFVFWLAREKKPEAEKEIMKLQRPGIAPKETASPSPPKILTKHPYLLGIHPDYEIDRIIAEAQIKFDEALGKRKFWSEQWEIYETKLKYSRCLDTPVIRRVTYTRWSTWQCTIAPESAKVELVVAWLDEIAKPIAGALPVDWEILVLPQPDRSGTRFKARDPANRIFMTVQVADTKDGFNGLLTFEISS